MICTRSTSLTCVLLVVLATAAGAQTGTPITPLMSSTSDLVVAMPGAGPGTSDLVLWSEIEGFWTAVGTFATGIPGTIVTLEQSSHDGAIYALARSSAVDTIYRVANPYLPAGLPAGNPTPIWTSLPGVTVEDFAVDNFQWVNGDKFSLVLVTLDSTLPTPTRALLRFPGPPPAVTAPFSNPGNYRISIRQFSGLVCVANSNGNFWGFSGLSLSPSQPPLLPGLTVPGTTPGSPRAFFASDILFDDAPTAGAQPLIVHGRPQNPTTPHHRIGGCNIFAAVDPNVTDFGIDMPESRLSANHLGDIFYLDIGTGLIFKLQFPSPSSPASPVLVASPFGATAMLCITQGCDQATPNSPLPNLEISANLVTPPWTNQSPLSYDLNPSSFTGTVLVNTSVLFAISGGLAATGIPIPGTTATLLLDPLSPLYTTFTVLLTSPVIPQVASVPLNLPPSFAGFSFYTQMFFVLANSTDIIGSNAVGFRIGLPMPN